MTRFFTFVAKADTAARVRRDHRPFWVMRASAALSQLYARQYVLPQLDAAGDGCKFINPRYFHVNGPRIRLGAHVHVMATRERPVSLTVYPNVEQTSRITLGSYCIILPGARLAAASSITAGNNCMFAGNCYLTDADWHDLYDRTSAPGQTEPITLGDNVWIGDSALVCKGVSLGDNCIVGAGAVVTRDVPANTIVAGNPARPVKELDPQQTFKRRQELFENRESYDVFLERYDRFMLQDNSLGRWLRSLVLPTREH
jgi:acetyltransferase-like isoleucine patch superfamily enzyme